MTAVLSLFTQGHCKNKARDALYVITALVITKNRRSAQTESDLVEPLLTIPSKQREHAVTLSFLPMATDMEACFRSITLIVFHESWSSKTWSSYIHLESQNSTVLSTSKTPPCFHSTVTIKTNQCDTPYNNQLKRSRLSFCPPDRVICTRRGEGV